MLISVNSRVANPGCFFEVRIWIQICVFFSRRSDLDLDQDFSWSLDSDHFHPNPQPNLDLSRCYINYIIIILLG